MNAAAASPNSSKHGLIGVADVVVFETPPKSDPPPLLTPECIKIHG